MGDKQVSAAVRLRTFKRYALERRCVLRSFKVALVVGTVLALINHYDAILNGSLAFTGILQVILTYAVPYSVATFGSASQAVLMQPGASPLATGELEPEGRF